jgi:hypothetical protein
VSGCLHRRPGQYPADMAVGIAAVPGTWSKWCSHDGRGDLLCHLDAPGGAGSIQLERIGRDPARHPMTDLATQIACKVLAVPEDRRLAATMEEVTRYLNELPANHPRMAEEELKDRGFTFLNDIRLACIELIQDGAAGTA